jgi:hypothetical protein
MKGNGKKKKNFCPETFMTLLGQFISVQGGLGLLEHY